MAEFFFAPTPNKEAAAFIASKPLVSRAVFAKLLPELKARAHDLGQLAEGAAFLKSEYEKWKQVIVDGKIKEQQ